MENALFAGALLGIYSELKGQTEISMADKMYMTGILTKNDYISRLKEIENMRNDEKDNILSAIYPKNEEKS